jgi:hypothetical protein
MDSGDGKELTGTRPPRRLTKGGLVVGAGDTIHTFSGGWIRPLDPDPADLEIIDIAHALSNVCRWAGHVSVFYSVAEHSVLASLIDPTLETLLHDASEAYLSDLARPIKHAPDLGDTYRRYERKLEIVVAQRFNLQWPMSAATKAADDAMLKREGERLMRGFGGLMEPPPRGTPIPRLWTPEEAKAEFLVRFTQLGGTA